MKRTFLATSGEIGFELPAPSLPFPSTSGSSLGATTVLGGLSSTFVSSPPPRSSATCLLDRRGGPLPAAFVSATDVGAAGREPRVGAERPVFDGGFSGSKLSSTWEGSDWPE